MTKLIDKGFADTPVENPVSLTMSRDQINFGADFRVLKSSPEELVITNVTSPIDRPERLRFARKEIGNIYQGSDISTSVHAPSKKGVNLHVQLQQTLEVTDSENPELMIHVPFTTSVTIKTPASFVDAEMALESVQRLLTGLYDTNSTSSTRMASLLRGSLAPTDI